MDCLKFLIEKKVCFKPPKYAKVKLLIKFIKKVHLLGGLHFGNSRRILQWAKRSYPHCI